jgi:AcrR family transcriptional regulator
MPEQLTRGPHSMSREEVERNQSDRILAAMSQLVAEHGYERTTVQRVTAAAGVSRKTFYELHRNREHWFLETCNVTAERLLARIEAASAESAEQTAAALIDFCLDDPVGARICFVETLAANDDARAWRDALVDQVTEAIASASAADGDPRVADESGRSTKLAARGAVGAVLELAGRRPGQLERGYAVALVTAMLATSERGGTGQ